MNNKRAGFTLVELLVVILIITILSSVVAVQLFREPAKAKIAAAKAQIENFELALDLYKLDAGQFPTDEQGLQALIERPTVAPVPQNYPDGEGYLKKLRLPLDPWKNEYVYMVPGSRGERYEIISYGADGEPGGESENMDISSSDL